MEWNAAKEIALAGRRLGAMRVNEMPTSWSARIQF